MYCYFFQMAPRTKGGEKGQSTLDKVVTREYTIHLHRKIAHVGYKKKAPRAIKVIKAFARREMRTKDIRIDTRVNKFVWTNGIK